MAWLGLFLREQYYGVFGVQTEGGYYAPCHTYLVSVYFIKVYL